MEAQAAPSTTPSSPVTIHFNRKGVLPPVYIATDFTDPAWDPIEMDFEADQASDHFKFSKTFPLVKPGEHQYKFRIGPGEEGWTVADDADMAVDKSGHENNWIFVKSSGSLQHPALSDPVASPLTSLPDSIPLTADHLESHESSSIVDAGSPTPQTQQEQLNAQEKTDSCDTVGAMPTPESQQAESSPNSQAEPVPKSVAPSSHGDVTVAGAGSDESTVQNTGSTQDTLTSSKRITETKDPMLTSSTEEEAVPLRWTVLLRDDVPSDLSTDAVMLARRPHEGAESRHSKHLVPLVNQYWDQGAEKLLPIDGGLAKTTPRSAIAGSVVAAASALELDSHRQPSPSTATAVKPSTAHRAKQKHASRSLTGLQNKGIHGFRRDALLLLASAALCAILALAVYLLQDDDAAMV